mmetsp:Transcript_78263/g.181584  ORF Transcript_78263/g.181584 Transcript_78263/m.181584 type:complete len:354 (-) Transcript_78263:49-1110(-)
MSTLRVALVFLILGAWPVQGLMPININAELEQQPPDHSNCAFGKVIPEFYVLGAKNTATTSLSNDLRERGVWAAPRNKAKEWQFFLRSDSLPDDEELLASWLAQLPECRKKRRVLADFSVTNLFANQLPADFEWSPQVGYAGRRHRAPDMWATAQRINHFHRTAGPATVPPKFVVMLRDPLARTQSEYYHTLPLQNCRGCMAKDNFVDSFALNVELLRHKQMSDWFWKSFYARQIEPYEQEFNASQFMFVPNKEYFAFDPSGFSSELLSWLELPNAQPWEKASVANSHTKPLLDAELPPDHPARVTYQELMEPECQRLVQLLSRMHKRGAMLPGYTGPSGDEVAVRAWLENGW